MSNRTWVCVPCCKSYRRIQSLTSLECPTCHTACEYVHWKIRIPSPKRAKAWDEFWTKYRAEKALLAEFERDKSIKEVNLELLNQHWHRA
jgi:C4-type Zn-finger protein